MEKAIIDKKRLKTDLFLLYLQNLNSNIKYKI